MRNWIIVLVAALLACSEMFPPELCGPVADQEVAVGTVKSVQVCFSDADGQSITLTATSLDEKVIKATVRGQAIALEAISVGESTVTVVATDSDNMMAEVMFGVTVPNRAPTLLGRLPSLELTDAEPSATIELSEYFTDPDGQTLMYEYTISDTSIIGAALSQAGALTITRKGTGRGTVQVRATDPGGLSVSGSIQVLTSGREVIFSEDFETGLAGWMAEPGTILDIDEGRARMARTDMGLAVAQAVVRRSTSWSLTATVENQTDQLWSTVIIFTGEGTLLGFFFGGDVQRMGQSGEPPTNFVFGYSLDGGNVWQSNPSLWGMHDAIKREGVPMTVNIVFRDDRIQVAVDGTTVLGLAANSLPVPTVIQKIAIAGAPPIGQGGNPTRYVYFDDITVDGIKLAASQSLSERFSRIGPPVITLKMEN